jgi:hypothetical protein
MNHFNVIQIMMMTVNDDGAVIVLIIAAATTVTTTTTTATATATLAANVLHMLNVKNESDAGNNTANWNCLKIIQKLSEPAYLESVTSSGHGERS